MLRIDRMRRLVREIVVGSRVSAEVDLVVAAVPATTREREVRSDD